MPTPALPALQCSVASEKSSVSRALKPLLAGSLALLLVACGGGGGQLGTMDPDKLPKPPPTAESQYRIGTGAGSGFQEGVINASHTTLRAGETTLLRVNVIQGNGEPLTGSTDVLFTSPCIATGLSSVTAPQQVTPGLYSVSYTNGSCAGTDTVTARLPNNKTATVVLTVSAAQALTVSHVSTSEDQLVLGGIGGIETSEVVFKVAGPQGVPITASTVNFSISSSAGHATVLSGWESGLTDHEGNVRTIIKSGTVAGPITVVATHAETGIQGHSSDIIISTGVAAADRFSISYSPWNPVDAFNTDGVEVDIQIVVTDMFGNPPTDGTRVTFVSPYNGLVDDFCEIEDGRCTIKWVSQGNRAAYNYRSVVLAYMDGAESFLDLNGNSVFDPGDKGQFNDLSEPFADLDGDGQYDNAVQVDTRA